MTRKYSEQYYQAHKEAIKRTSRLYYQTHTAYFQRYYQTHKERMLASSKQVKLKRRAQVIQRFGGKCVFCGFNDARALQVDHKSGGGAKELRRFGDNYAYDVYLLSLSELDLQRNYQLLCANCNWIKRVDKSELWKSRLHCNGNDIKKALHQADLAQELQEHGISPYARFQEINELARNIARTAQAHENSQ